MESLDYSFDDIDFHHLSSMENSQNDDVKPSKEQLKTNTWNSCNSKQKTPIPSSHVISFKNSNSPPVNSHQIYGFDGIRIEAGLYNEHMKFEYHNCSKNRSSLHAKDHVMAERQRRATLTERFIALSAVVPVLKKMDKASVLGGAIKYMKQLQQRVKSLEEQAALTKKTQVSVRNLHLFLDDEDDKFYDEEFSKIEVKVSGKDVLIRIYCEQQEGCIAELLKEIEKFHLIIINSNIFPFGNSTLDVTVVAQMEDEFCTTTENLVRNLQLALVKF